jgi:dipeptidyl aminopeptidase/acylaminoacyl peptidase
LKEKEKSMIDLGILLRVPCIEVEMGFDISPDGEKVAYSWNPDGHWEIYELYLRGQANPQLISRGSGGKFHPQYSPDGRYLAFAVDFDGSENFHIFIHDFTDGRQRELAPEMNCDHQAYFAWAPDSKRIAFISDQTGQFNVYVIPIQGGKERLVMDAGHPAWKVRWSPDGSMLAVTIEAGGIDYGTFVVPLKGGTVVQISDEQGPIDAGQACWSPDSKHLAFSSDTHGFNNIGIYEVSTRGIIWLTDGEGEKQFPCWSPDGKLLAYVFNRGTVSWLALQKLGEAPELYQVEPGVHYWPEFTPDGQTLIFCFDNPRHPDDLWSLRLADGQFTQLTSSLPEELAIAPFIMPEEITYPGLDGTPIPALLFVPPGQKPAPAVIIIHGGPDWLFEMTWCPLMASMASRGWVVMAPNYRGSTGYGRAWQAASRFDFGGVDTDDVTAGALYLIRLGLANKLRIGITGRSHGGYLTASCMTRYPELWAAGSAVVPFLNWFTNHKEIRPDLQHWDIENFGDPVENDKRWHDHSPSFYLDRINAPLQLICGGSDVRCPVSDSIEARDRLQEMGKVVDFILYENEGNIFLNMEKVIDSETRRIDFLAKYLEGNQS